MPIFYSVYVPKKYENCLTVDKVIAKITRLTFWTILYSLVTVVWLMLQALRVARTELFVEARPNVTRLAVLITDGKPGREVADIIPEANLLKAENVEVFCVGITDDVSITRTVRTQSLCQFPSPNLI